MLQQNITLLLIESISILTLMIIIISVMIYHSDNDGDNKPIEESKEHMSNILTHTNQTSNYVNPNQINDHQIINKPYDFTAKHIINNRNRLSEDDNIKFNSSIIGDYSYLESNNKQKDLSSIIYEESVYMPLSDRFFTNSNDVSEIQRKRTHIELNEILSAAEQKERLKQHTKGGSFKNSQTVLENTI